MKITICCICTSPLSVSHRQLFGSGHPNNLFYLLPPKAGFVGIQSRSHFISLIFTGLQVYGLHASYQLLNFYWFSKFDPSELEEMRVNIENYVRTNGSLGHMHRFQERGQCCGLDSKDIYNASSLGIPYSCCINGKPGQECPYERAFNRPCISRYHKRFIFYRYINLTLFSSIGIIQICAIFFSLIFICLVPKKRPEPVCEPTSV